MNWPISLGFSDGPNPSRLDYVGRVLSPAFHGSEGEASKDGWAKFFHVQKSEFVLRELESAFPGDGGGPGGGEEDHGLGGDDPFGFRHKQLLREDLEGVRQELLRQQADHLLSVPKSPVAREIRGNPFAPLYEIPFGSYPRRCSCDEIILHLLS